MNGKAKAVLWMGFAMIIMGIIADWSQISAVLFGGKTISRQGDTFGNPPTTVTPHGNGKCPPGYSMQSDGTCRLHSRLPL